MEFRISHHAREEMARRGITPEQLELVLNNPDQIIEESGGKKAYQSRMTMESKMYLLRIIVNDAVEPAVVVTMYRTSKVHKYWRLQ